MLNRMECGHSGNRMLVKLTDLALDKKTTIRDKGLYIQMLVYLIVICEKIS